MGHFGESHFAPFRNSLVFSRRQRLQSAPVYRAILFAYSSVLAGSDPAPLGRPAAIVRDRGDVLDRADLQASGLQGPDRGLAARARTLDEHVNLAHAVLHRPAGGRLGGHLRGEGRRLPRALETDLARRSPGDHAARWVGNGHDRVVEGALDVGVPVRDVLSFLAPDVGLDLAAQVTLDLVVRLDPVPELDDFLVGHLMNAPVTADPRRAQGLERPGTADAVDIGQGDLKPLLPRQVDTY